MGIGRRKNKICLKRAVFLDRDGTVVCYVDLPSRLSQLRFLPNIPKAITELNRLGFFVVMASNQPVVARGLITEKNAEEIDNILIQRLKKSGAIINAAYRCPHHPNANLKKYRIRCKCRKPGSGMFLKAAKDFGINLKNSFMIGDSIIDVVAGKRAGLKTILVKTGPGHARLDKLYKIRPDFVSKNLQEAVKIIKNVK